MCFPRIDINSASELDDLIDTLTRDGDAILSTAISDIFKCTD